MNIPNFPTFIGDGPSGAVFDDSRLYRYTLWRRWVDNCPLERMCCFIGLNPSTADETADDPTIRRCINFSKSWGFAGYVMLNLFAFRATDPVDMYRQTDRVGKLNDEVLQIVPALMGRTVMAWGAGAVHRKLGADANRCAMLQGWLREYPQVYYLRRTKHGHPEHPLYVPGDVVPVLWGCCEINKRMEQSE